MPAESALSRFGAQVNSFVAHYLGSWQPYRPFWNYEDGCVFKGCIDLAEATGESRFRDFVYREVSTRVASDGALRGYDPNEFNIDNINAGKVLFPLYAQTQEPRFRLAIEHLAAQLERHPRTASGNFWHKRIYPSQVWLDGLYMAQPFRCAYATFTGRTDIFDDVAHQFAQVRARMRDERTGLYYHGWDETRSERWSHPRTGCSPCFWGRAMGWFAMGLIDCHEIAKSASARTAGLLSDLLCEVCDALMRVRSPHGLWYQVLDQGARKPDMLGGAQIDPYTGETLPRAGNYEEASASLMFAYTFMKGARLGALSGALGNVGFDSLLACIRHFLTDRELRGICAVAGLGNVPYRDGSYEYYLSEPVVANDPKGVGALLMALAEGVRRS